ncbi:MAG: hypothetical protein ACFFDH_12705 [Promethearchaeota archaeon]
MKIELINKKKVRADDYVSIFIVISFAFFFMFFHLEALLAIAIYPFVALTVQGVLKIITGVRRKIEYNQGSINKILLGIIYITISLLWFNFILIQSYLPLQIIISIAAFPIMIAGFAGIVKGLIIDSYSMKYRVMNIFVGLTTLIICLLAFSYTIKNFLFNVILLCFTLLFNIVSRAALYLSEYGLSLIHFNNFLLFLYIISDYLVYIDRDGNIILSKFE